MQRFIAVPILLCALLALGLSACDSGSAPSAPTEQSVNPPATAAATVTASQSRANVGNQSPAVLRAALERTKDAKVYRMSLDFTTSTGDTSQLKQQTFIKFDGEID